MLTHKEVMAFKQRTPASSLRHKRRKRSELSSKEMTQIVHLWMAKKMKQKEVTLLFRVSIGLI